MTVRHALARLRYLNATLADSFPYAAALAESLRTQRPGWWQAFTAADPVHAQLPMQQARDLAFVSWCETHLPPADIDPIIEAAITQAPSFMAQELINSAEWASRS